MRIFVNVGDEVWTLFGKIRCVKDRKNAKSVCSHCALNETLECREYECQDDYRQDHTSVHFEKVKDEL